MTRVASYCRVSTDKEDQANSFEAQQRYFRDYIAHRPDWELCGIYADEGITGTSTKKRVQFNRMIADAFDGKFQLILTKEVSRFSRNILDTIAYTRELKAIGVGVLFVLDGINTLNPDAELYLSIMGSIAQEESRKTSSRVVWGQTRQMERGVVFGRSLLGYDVRDGRITVEPEGAGIVRLIFQKYALEQTGPTEIARLLTQGGFGGLRWSPSAVIRVLKNEKYMGDLIQRKTYTPDYLTHEKRRNDGAVPMVRIENHHQPIVSRELWDLAQERLKRNNKHTPGASGHSNRYAFSGKILCGECGTRFVGRYKYEKNGTKYRRWSCATASRKGTAACGVGKLVRDDDAVNMLKTALRSLQLDDDGLAAAVAGLASDTIRAGERADDPGQLQCLLQKTRQKKESMMDSYFSGDITKAEMHSMKQRYDAQLESLSRRLDTAKAHQGEEPELLQTVFRSELSSLLRGETDSEAFFKTVLESLTVFQDRHMELRLQHLEMVFVFST